MHGRTASDECQKGENATVLDHSKRNSVGERFALTWGLRSIRVSVEKRSYLERVYTVRRSERGDELCHIVESFVVYSGLDRYPIKCLKKRVHVMTSVRFENQFRCKVLKFLLQSKSREAQGREWRR